MYIDLMKTLRKIEKLLPENEVQDATQLEKAYELTLRLRSQLIAVRYDVEHRERARQYHIVDASPPSGRRRNRS